VTVHRLLQNSAFGPDDIDRMVEAYEDCLKKLGINNRTDPVTDTIALKIIEVAQTGERDPVKMRSLALHALGLSPRKA
jgi:hypothetical protein